MTYTFLTTMLPITFGGGLAGVERFLERLVDVLPADDRQRVSAAVLEELGDGLAHDPVAFVLELLHLEEVLATRVRFLSSATALRQVLDCEDEHAALSIASSRVFWTL